MNGSVKRTAIMLWILLVLFVFRVVGQLIVVLWAPGFLPPMHAWYSGLMPYRYLLPVQILIVIFLTMITLDISRGSGFWARPKCGLGLLLWNFGIIYFFSMVIRYFLQMSWHSDQRWFGGTIPIVFHCVLATYIILLGKYYLDSSNSEAG